MHSNVRNAGGDSTRAHRPGAQARTIATGAPRPKRRSIPAAIPPGGESERPAGSAGRRSNSGVGRDQGIHACHLAELASIHCFAASSGVMFLFVIASATEFWSWLAHLKFLMNVAASPPVSMNFVRTILLRMYGG